MSEILIRTIDLSKKYGSHIALSDASITLRKGHIYGLVGKNGSGKTTLMRMLTGQAHRSSGEVYLFGESENSKLLEGRKRIGAIIESPSFYPYLTARENLEYYRVQRGIAGRECIDEVLKTVGLHDTGKKQYKQFSLGMKQRLGLALSLLNNPDILILDEPINGLDPMAIIEFRNTLLRLNQEKNITMIISSHILTELSNIATFYGFIEKGKVIEEISAKDLEDKCKTYIDITVSSTSKASQILEKELGHDKYKVLPDNRINLYESVKSPGEINSILVNSGVEVSSLFVKKIELENYFLSLIGGKIDV